MQSCPVRHSQGCSVLLIPRPNLVLGVAAQVASLWFNSATTSEFSCDMDPNKLLARALDTVGFSP